MRFTLEELPGYLRARLVERETVGETREFLRALLAAARTQRQARVMICVEASRPIFKIEQYQASAYLKELAAQPQARVALVSSQRDIRAAHEYIELVARQQGASVRSFANEASAACWLLEKPQITVESARADSGVQ